MAPKVVIGLALGLTLAACGDRERAPVAAPVAPALAQVQGLDTMPDLIVDARRLAASWLILEETIEATSCNVVEGGVAPGVHRLLRFTVTTPNVGTGDVFVGDPFSHWLANDGLFELALCHGHFHFRNYAMYELVSVTGATVHAAKRGFCMLDVTPWAADVPPGPWTYRDCGSSQGISAGWADTYSKWLDGQFFVVDDLVGEYRLRITVNPPFMGEPCPAQDLQGFCHMFAERDYTNNVGEALIQIPARVGRMGFGPATERDSDEVTSMLLKTAGPWATGTRAGH